MQVRTSRCAYDDHVCLSMILIDLHIFWVGSSTDVGASLISRSELPAFEALWKRLSWTRAEIRLTFVDKHLVNQCLLASNMASRVCGYSWGFVEKEVVALIANDILIPRRNTPFARQIFQDDYYSNRWRNLPSQKLCLGRIMQWHKTPHLKAVNEKFWVRVYIWPCCNSYCTLLLGWPKVVRSKDEAIVGLCRCPEQICHRKKGWFLISDPAPITPKLTPGSNYPIILMFEFLSYTLLAKSSVTHEEELLVEKLWMNRLSLIGRSFPKPSNIIVVNVKLTCSTFLLAFSPHHWCGVTFTFLETSAATNFLIKALFFSTCILEDDIMYQPGKFFSDVCWAIAAWTAGHDGGSIWSSAGFQKAHAIRSCCL